MLVLSSISAKNLFEKVSGLSATCFATVNSGSFYVPLLYWIDHLSQTVKCSTRVEFLCGIRFFLDEVIGVSGEFNA